MLQIIKALAVSVDAVSVFLLRLMACLVPFMAFALLYEVISRYWFNSPTVWAQDIAIFFFGYVGILAGAGAMKEDRHIRVDVFYGKMKPRTQALFDSLVLPLALFFLGAVTVMTWEEAWKAIEQGRTRSTDWAPPVGHMILAISAGAGLLFTQTFANWVRSLIHVITGKSLYETTHADANGDRV